ncbi:ankyrin repeat domain-containing protein, partial [Wolbachia endosymbiont (group B) of Melanostoma mellinum]|uniref:ankyrin repeat domain-containing protein n=1 Tax=Wolbachia endosymbiont (group B) of Melanostoma mellinum TaxID=2954030 RepID=UPI00222FEF67
PFWFRESVLNDHNLDLFKDFLQESYKHAYKEWKEKEFDINHLFSLEEIEYRYQSTLLHLVVGDFDYLEEEKKKLIRYLLDEGANVNALDSFRNTPLHKSHEKEVTQILLDAGANVNKRNSCGNTPLHESCYKEVIQILLDADANPFIKDHYGKTARDCTYDKESSF